MFVVALAHLKSIVCMVGSCRLLWVVGSCRLLWVVVMGGCPCLFCLFLFVLFVFPFCLFYF